MDTISFGNLTTQNTQMTPEMQKRIDDLSKECREVDIKIQAQNWTVDLV